MLTPKELGNLVVDHVTEHPESQAQDCGRLGCCYPHATCLGGWVIHFSGIPFDPDSKFAMIRNLDIPEELMNEIRAHTPGGYPGVLTSSSIVIATLLDLTIKQVGSFYDEMDKEIALDRFKEVLCL